jgi:hypothetical protein
LPARSSPADVFRKFGLSTRRVWRGLAPPGAAEEPSGAARFRGALEELGGIYACFAQFLSWRADLLRSDYLGQLRAVRVQPPAAERWRVVEALEEFGEPGAALASTLELDPCWNTFSRFAFRGELDGKPVAVEAAHAPFEPREFEGFESGIGLLKDEGARLATAPAVLAQFRQWCELGATLERERSYLNTLNSGSLRSNVQHPLVIAPFSNDRVLCLSWVEGEPAGPLILKGSVAAVRKVAEGLLEQICMLSVIDGEFDPESIVITRDGRMGIRHACRYLAIPPSQAATALKYISGVLARNSTAAAHALSRLAYGRAGGRLEPELLEALSDLEPELKVNLQFPRSASIFEGNWRALSHVQAARPLFLDLMHRNLVALGYWNAETTPVTAGSDLVAEAQWPVIGRLLRARLREMATREMASEWFIGSGLLFFEGLRQVNRLADEFRENDLSIGVDAQETSDSSAPQNRLVRSAIIIGMLLIVFLVSVRWAAALPAPYSAVLSAVAGVAGAGLFWAVSRIG